MNDLDQESLKAVTVGNADRYQFSVDIPQGFVEHSHALRLIGTGPGGEKLSSAVLDQL